MESFIHSLIDWFALPRNGLGSVFLIAFASATLLPMGSEPAVFAYAKLNPDQFWAVVAVATAGNTLGGAVNWWMGRGASAAITRGRNHRLLRWFGRLGPRALLVSFLPVVGDPMCALAGWLRLPFWRCIAWIALGRVLRYTLMTSLLLWVPDGWWRGLGGLIGL
jgi:membrane protein YqaA with SNARE-associated domain